MDSSEEEVFGESGEDSSNTGSEILYFSLAQLPRSVKRQRSLQKGKSLPVAVSVGFWQMGHLHSMAGLRRESGMAAQLRTRHEAQYDS